MIGHYLLTLTPEQENALLTKAFWPYEEETADNFCMIQCAEGIDDPFRAAELHDWRENYGYNTHLRYFGSMGQRHLNPADRYDALCRAHGTEMINDLIRRRILRNKLWRIMKQRELSSAGAE